MGDFTKLGISVPPLQYDYIEGGVVATPDVNGIARALHMVYDDLSSKSPTIASPENLDKAKSWVQNHFHFDMVTNAFLKTLSRAKLPKYYAQKSIISIVGNTDIAQTPWIVVYDEKTVSIDQVSIHNLMKMQADLRRLPAFNLLKIEGRSSSLDFVWEASKEPYAVLLRTYLYLQATTIFASPRLRLGWLVSKIGVQNVGEIPLNGLARYVGNDDDFKKMKMDL